MKVTLNWREKFYIIHSDDKLNILEQKISFDDFSDWNTIYDNHGPLFDCQIDFDHTGNPDNMVGECFQFQYVNLVSDESTSKLDDGILSQGDDWRNADEFIVLDAEEGYNLEMSD